jgi:hypothetical protein
VVSVPAVCSDPVTGWMDALRVLERLLV